MKICCPGDVACRPAHPLPCRPATDLMEVVEAVRFAPAALWLSQLQGLQASGTQRAAEQLQEQRAGDHTCQLVQQPLASCRGSWNGEVRKGEHNNNNNCQTTRRGSLLFID